MDQLEMFKQQLRKSPVTDGEKVAIGRAVEEHGADEGEKGSAVREAEKVNRRTGKVSAQKERGGRTTCLRVSPSTLRKLRVISIWLESEGEGKRPTMMAIMEEAVEYLLEQRYPQARRLLK